MISNKTSVLPMAVLFVSLWYLASSTGCSSGSSPGGATGGTTSAAGGSTPGGPANGGAVVGGGASGGQGSGGAGAGGSVTGGQASGGSGAGGSASGGASAGGSAAGGQAMGGSRAGTGGSVGGDRGTGGIGTGGSANGGRGTRGTGTGGSAIGGQATGGVGTGGSANGGRASGGAGAGGSAGKSGQTCTTGESNCFSFFVTSRARLFALAEKFNGSTSGWGGDLRYGTGDGLMGADKICTEIAEASLPGNKKTWKAFLSTSSVNAIDRVGAGPWYDRLNRIIANNRTELTATRPGGITNSTILHNLPNEDGTPHHNEEAGCTTLNQCADNHDVLTGSDSDGKVCTASTCSGMLNMPGGGGSTITDWTCNNWTSAAKVAGSQPRVGHTWPTSAGIGGGSNPGQGDDWISWLDEGGCLPGANLKETGLPDPNQGTVGSGGGYGAIYCLATSTY
jgi:hypothetical protein